MKKITYTIIFLFSFYAGTLRASVTISQLPFVNLNKNNFDDGVCERIENVYNAALKGNENDLFSKCYFKDRLDQIAYVKYFSEQIKSQNFCTLLRGYESKILDNKKIDVYLIVLNIISGENGKSFGVNSFIHVWIHNKENNDISLFIPDSKTIGNIIDSIK